MQLCSFEYFRPLVLLFSSQDVLHFRQSFILQRGPKRVYGLYMLFAQAADHVDISIQLGNVEVQVDVHFFRTLHEYWMAVFDQCVLFTHLFPPYFLSFSLA